VDLNGDGILDLTTGEYSPGTVHWFEGTAGGFKARQDIAEEGADPKDMNRWASAATFTDWNGDGLPDMLVGSVMGGVYVNLNKGTKQAFKFGKREPVLLSNGTPVKMTGKSFPVAIDWDGDRAADLLVGGEDGRITFFKGDSRRRFAPGVALEADGKPIQLGYRTKFCVTDWNGDGVRDLVVGDAETSGNKTTGFVYLVLGKK
jgi:hypothetical protein